MAAQVYSLSWLANALTVLFPITTVLLVFQLPGSTAKAAHPSSGIYLHVSGIAGMLFAVVMLTTIILFLNWLYRARKNAGMTTWRQRWSPAWTIWAWFLPPVLLWFPYQIMADIWRAGRRPDRRQGAASAALPGVWWALWILAWVTSFQHPAAAIVLVVIIRKVSAGPVGHPPTPGVPSEMSGDIATG